MSLGLLTLLPFFILTPGVIFLIGIRMNSAGIVPRDVFHTQTQEIVALLFVAAISFLICFGATLCILPEFIEYVYLESLLIYSTNYEINLDQIKIYLYIWILFLLSIYLCSYLLGRLIPKIFFGMSFSDHIAKENLRRFLYQLKKNEVLLAWVLTNTQQNEKVLLYYGLVKSLKMNLDTISRITLEFPSKTYIDFESFLETNHQDSENIHKLPKDLNSLNDQTEAILYIEGTNIANVYFEKLSLQEETFKKEIWNKVLSSYKFLKRKILFSYKLLKRKIFFYYKFLKEKY